MFSENPGGNGATSELGLVPVPGVPVRLGTGEGGAGVRTLGMTSAGGGGVPGASRGEANGG